MDLKKIVLHQLIKEEYEAPTLNLSDHLLPINETTEEFVEKIIKSYSSKNPTYGTFLEEDVYQFQNYAKAYFQDFDFLEFTSKSMEILKKEIDVPKATGGYVVFIHYTQNKTDFLITIMLDKSVQFSVDDIHLSLKKLKSLDIDKLARANRLNYQKWKNGDELYLSFIKGTREVSRYFQKFIGSTDLTSTKENANRLKNALYSFMDQMEYTPSKQDETLSRIKHYTLKQIDDEQDVNLRTISILVDNENPDDFVTYIDENELEVSGAFRVKRKQDFDFLYRVIVKEKGYSLKFDKELLKAKKITVQDNKIIINNVPGDVLRDIK